MRRFCLAVVASFGFLAAASAQAPIPAVPPAPSALASPYTGLMPAPAAQPMYVVAAPTSGCATPAAAPCATSACGPTARNKLVSRAFIGCGTANPASCGTIASDRSFMFGSCNAFFTPCKTCGGAGIEYGSGGMGPKDGCKHVTSYTNR